jgi:predicted short-subunit dehydrogenase-like oxidoreductase (DUF2520 family)
MQWQLTAICNQHLDTAQHQVDVLNSGQAVASISALPHAPVTFITTSDDALQDVAEALASNPFLMPGDMVVHCSGVYSSAILSSLKSRGCHVASLHPLRAFPSKTPNAEAFFQCDCVVEGDESVVTFLSMLFGQLGAKVISLSAEKKQQYHAAATMASNYLVTLASSATSLLIDAGIESSQAKLMCERLMENSLRNMKGSARAEQALTGPLMRGDMNTLLLHLNAIKSPHIEGLYRAAGLATLSLTNHSDDHLAALNALLTGSISSLN